MKSECVSNKLKPMSDKQFQLYDDAVDADLSDLVQHVVNNDNTKRLNESKAK